MHFVSVSVHSEQLEVCLKLIYEMKSKTEKSSRKCGRLMSIDSKSTKINV